MTRMAIRTCRHRSALRSCIAAIAAIVLHGCGTPAQLSVADVDPHAWQKAASLVIENRDTLTLRDIDLFVRSTGQFAEDTLSVRIVSLSPDSLRCEERLLLTIPPRTRTAARLHESTTPYRSRALLPRSGCYRLTVVPLRPARGIEAIGVRIVPSAPDRP